MTLPIDVGVLIICWFLTLRVCCTIKGMPCRGQYKKQLMFVSGFCKSDRLSAIIVACAAYGVPCPWSIDGGSVPPDPCVYGAYFRVCGRRRYFLAQATSPPPPHEYNVVGYAENDAAPIAF